MWATEKGLETVLPGSVCVEGSIRRNALPETGKQGEILPLEKGKELDMEKKIKNSVTSVAECGQ